MYGNGKYTNWRIFLRSKEANAKKFEYEFAGMENATNMENTGACMYFYVLNTGTENVNK